MNEKGTNYQKYRKRPVNTMVMGKLEFVNSIFDPDLWAMPGKFFLTTEQLERFAEKEGHILVRSQI